MADSPLACVSRAESVKIAPMTSLVLAALIPLALVGQVEKGKPVFTFSGASYYHRFSKGTQHEYTPEGQADLKKWTEMVTINRYPTVKDGEALAKTANNVLGAYENAKAQVLRTNSVPRTPTKPSEHLIVVVFTQPTFMEVAFARLVMDKGTGASVVYSHRFYGKTPRDATDKWLRANGEKIEKALLAMPVPATPKK